MIIELTRDQVSTLKESLRWSIRHISEYRHDNYEIKKSSLKPYEDVLAALPALRKVKDL